MLLAALAVTLAAAYSWKQRGRPGALALTLQLAATAQWSLAAAIESAVPTMSAKILWSQIEYLGYAATAPLFLIFVLHFTQRMQGWPLGSMIVLWSVPLASQILVWTNPLHNLVWTGFSFGSSESNVLVYHHGIWFWILVIYSYFLCFLSGIILFRAWQRGGRTLKSHIMVLLIAMVTPLAASAVYVMGLSPVPGMDVTCMGFAVSGIIIIWGLRSLGLFQLIPVARATLVEIIPDGLIVLDSEFRLADLNSQSQMLLKPASPPIPGTGFQSILRDSGFMSSPDFLPGQGTCWVTSRDGATFLEMRLKPISDQSGLVLGGLVTIRDVTDERLRSLEREKMITDLRQALDQIKTLKGLVPICSSCKKIRDDQGYWNHLESYLKEWTGAEFSHSYCPDCVERLYPGLLDEDEEPNCSGNHQ